MEPEPSPALSTGDLDDGVRWIDLRPARTIEPEQQVLGMRVVAPLLLQLPEPADLAFVIDADEGRVRTRLRVRSITDDLADHVAALLGSAIVAVAPWLDARVLDPTDTSDALAPPRPDWVTATFDVVDRPASLVVAQASFLWTAVSRMPTSARLEVRLFEFVPPKDAEAERAEGTLRASVALSAPAAQAGLFASLVELDAIGPPVLVSTVSRSGVPTPPAVELTMPMVGRLLAGPFTVPTLWQHAPRMVADDFGDVLARATPPHAVVMGGSGQGKTVLLANAIDQAVARGSTVVVLCPHGDLAAWAAAIVERRGAPATVLDFGNTDDPPLWNLSEPDAGVSPNEWARRLSDVVRLQLWSESPGDWFGPVWLRSFAAAIRILVEDPDGPWPLVRFPEVLDTEDSSLRDGALARIGDPALTRTIRNEVMPMLTRSDAGNAAVWLVSKLDPLIGDPTVARIINTRHSTVSVAEVVEGRSLIVSLPQSVLTETGSGVLGGVLLDRVWQVVRRRPRGSGAPVEVFVDEWHQVPSPALGAMLAEGRKFGLRLRLANQHLAQLRDDLRDAVLGNAGVIATFRTGHRDAHLLDGLFPTVSTFRMQTLPRHTLAYTTGESDAVVTSPAPLSGLDPDGALQRLYARHLGEARRRLIGDLAGGLAALLHRTPPPPRSFEDELADLLSELRPR